MDTTSLLWGLLAVICGGFFAIYGFSLFRISLFAIGLLIGFSLGMSFTQGQSEFIRIIVSLVAGGILGAALYFMFNLGLYVAGGVLGFFIAMLGASLLTVNNDVIRLGAIIVGILVGTFFGRFLGDLIIILATSVAGAYAIVYGLAIMFPDVLGALPAAGLIPISWFSLALIIAFVVISGLAQYQIFRLRRRLVR